MKTGRVALPGVEDTGQRGPARGSETTGADGISPQAGTASPSRHKRTGTTDSFSRIASSPFTGTSERVLARTEGGPVRGSPYRAVRDGSAHQSAASPRGDTTVRCGAPPLKRRRDSAFRPPAGVSGYPLWRKE